MALKSFDFLFVKIDEATQCCEIEALILIIHEYKYIYGDYDNKKENGENAC